MHTFLATVGAMSKEGNKVLNNFMDSFDEIIDIEELQASMSEGMMKFLRLGSKVVEDKDE